MEQGVKNIGKTALWLGLLGLAAWAVVETIVPFGSEAVAGTVDFIRAGVSDIGLTA